MNHSSNSMNKKPKITQAQCTRRQFLRAATLSSAGFMIVPGSVLGLRGATPPSGKLNIAGIGFGGQGAHDLAQMESENIIALCDVDKLQAGRIFTKYSKAKQFADYRKMLDEMKEIDAVVIATPDHHHAFASMEAIKRGKHVYCEKPLTHSVWEARQVANAAREAKVATQMGNQGQASEATRRLCELVWAGVIGKVHEAHIWTDRPSQGLFNEYWPQGVPRPKDTPAVPTSLDWDLWLGPAPFRPFHPAYLPFKWRGWWDFGTGALGDIGCHAMDPVFRALKLTAPLSVQAASTRVNDETYPLGSIVTYQFPARDAAPQATNRHDRPGPTGCPKAARWVTMDACSLETRVSSWEAGRTEYFQKIALRTPPRWREASRAPTNIIRSGSKPAKEVSRLARTSISPDRSLSRSSWATWPSVSNSGKNSPCTGCSGIPRI